MATPILMPKLSFVVTQGTIIEWLKEPGETVTKGEFLLTVESEKAIVDVEAPGNGILGAQLAPPGTTVPVTAVIGYLLEPGEESPQLVLDQTGPESAESTLRLEQPAAAAGPALKERIKASPSAKRLATEHGIDLASIEGSGPDGRILQEDVEAYMQRQTEQKEAGSNRLQVSPVARRVADRLGVDLRGIEGTGPRGRITKQDVEQAAQPTPEKPSVSSPPLSPGLTVEAVELTAIQRVAAERMAQSFRTAPHFYLNVEMDMSRVVEMRTMLLPGIEAKHGVRLSYTDILVYAVGRALRAHPDLNASFEGDALARYKEINPCLAVDTPQGLTVPVFYGADHLSLSQIALRRAEVVQKAQNNRLGGDDLKDGTFTLSNLGMFGIDVFQAIINPPQAAILAVGSIARRPVVVGDALEIRPTMWLTLSVDHRAADGATAARFLQELTGYLKNPYQMLV